MFITIIIPEMHENEQNKGKLVIIAKVAGSKLF